jgi:hypothetical protein
MKRNLRDHRKALSTNNEAYSKDITRTYRTALNQLKQCNYPKLTEKSEVIKTFVNFIFETQDFKPFFHIESELPYCWNQPGHWNLDYIRYEWGHLRSKNQNTDAHKLDNLCLMSARCNQHVQAALNIDEVLQWLKGSSTATRIETVQKKRSQLFKSDKWKTLVKEFDSYK